MLMFLIGMGEMVIATLWTKYVAETRIAASSTITILNIFVWYYVLRMVMEDINNFSVIVFYALGCGLGTALSLIVPEYILKNKKVRKTRRMGIAKPLSAVPTLTAYESK